MAAPEPDEPEGFSLTPMIDVTFQLIIFFMLVMDMSSQQIEVLKLPTASTAIKEKFADDKMVVLNIRKDGSIWLQGKRLFTPPPKERPQDYEAKPMEDFFINRRMQKQFQETVGKDDGGVTYPLLIRADRSANWQWVQFIMMVATFHGGVTKVQLGAYLVEEKKK